MSFNPLSYIEMMIGQDIAVVWAILENEASDFEVRAHDEKSVRILFNGVGYRVLIDDKARVVGVKPVVSGLRQKRFAFPSYEKIRVEGTTT